MAAIRLALAGHAPLLIDRDREVGDALCGGFMSWTTARHLRAVGIDLAALGARPVTRLTIFAGARSASVTLPHASFGLSRHALDSALRSRAIEAGARLEIDRARELRPGLVVGARRDWRAETILLATGKHDLRGALRPRRGSDPALGLRLRIPVSPALSALVSGRIELHLFPGAYAGIVEHEDGSANVALALRKSAFADGSPRAVIDRLAETNPAFAQRLELAPADAPIDAIGAVPYGFIQREPGPGVFRIGDQAAVIPSLAGEGMAIALASGGAAADHWLRGGSEAAPAFQRAMARRARSAVKVAGLAWRTAETGIGARLGCEIATRAPGAIRLAMRLSRF